LPVTRDRPVVAGGGQHEATMSMIEIRKRALNVETVFHEGGPPADPPLRMGSAVVVIRNPFAGRYEPDLMPFMAELRALGHDLAQELADALGRVPAPLGGLTIDQVSVHDGQR